MIRKRSGWPLDKLVAARHLEREFARLHAGVGEEHGVGEGVFDQPLRQRFLARHAIEIGSVPELARLLGQRRHQLGMGMAEGADGDSRPEIEVSLPILGEKVWPFAPDERDIRPVIGWQQ